MKKRTTPETYICEHCGEENKWKYSSHNKFCNNNCQRLYEWENITKPKVEAGECRVPSSAVLRYLIESTGYVCSCCNISEWNGEFLTLDIDHIDGNNKNNSLNNLRLLCPNCHRQTPTWGNNRKAAVPQMYETAMRLL